MSPLDTGSDSDGPAERAVAVGPTPDVSIHDAATLAEALKAAREGQARSLNELSDLTRVHVRYLRALEQGDFAGLPSRPFALGYVRAYARALGLDEETAAERFKREAPDPSQPLQAPVGVAFDEVKSRRPQVIAALAVLGVAVVGWNVYQRANAVHRARPNEIAATPESWTLGTIPGVMRLDAPRPAPADQTVPVAYITPGLEEELTGIIPPTPGSPEAAAAAAAPVGPVQAAFNPRGAVFGEAPNRSSVTIQARKSANIVVKGPDGAVYFARQLAAGEAYRAPRGAGVVLDVSEPGAFSIYLNGEYGGLLEAAVTPLSQLNARAEQMARQAAADVAARTAAAARQMVAQAAPVPTAAATTQVSAQ